MSIDNETEVVFRRAKLRKITLKKDLSNVTRGMLAEKLGV